jgi:hypothetical protein
VRPACSIEPRITLHLPPSRRRQTATGDAPHDHIIRDRNARNIHVQIANLICLPPMGVPRLPAPNRIQNATPAPIGCGDERIASGRPATHAAAASGPDAKSRVRHDHLTGSPPGRQRKSFRIQVHLPRPRAPPHGHRRPQPGRYCAFAL